MSVTTSEIRHRRDRSTGSNAGDETDKCASQGAVTKRKNARGCMGRLVKRVPASDWDKEDLATVVHWLRQLVGLGCGILWGLIPLTGFYGNIGFLATNYVFLYIYYAKYLEIDVDEMGGFELVSEGFVPSYALFLVVWIATYSISLE